MERKNELRSIPGLLLQKAFLTGLIGIGCLLVGTAYSFGTKDVGFLMLSGLVFVFSMIRSLDLYRTAAEQKYEVIEGTCIGISVKPFKKQVRIHIMDEDGIETTLRIGKAVNVKTGLRYRFYFKRDGRPFLGNEYLDTVFSTEYFLGFEKLGRLSEHSK